MTPWIARLLEGGIGVAERLLDRFLNGKPDVPPRAERKRVDVPPITDADLGRDDVTPVKRRRP